MRILVIVVVVLALPATAEAQRDVAAKHYTQGEAYMKTEQYDLAAAEFEKAYTAVPKAGFLFNIGLAYEQAGQAKKAAENYRRYIADDPDGQKVEEARARASKLESDLAAEDERTRNKEAKRADEDAQRARVEGIIDEAQRKRAAGDYDGAIVDHRTAHAVTQNPERLFDIAELHREAGNLVDAKVHFDSYIAAAPAGARHIEARRHIETLTSEIAAAAAPRAKPPGPWSGGLKLGVRAAQATNVVPSMGCDLGDNTGPAASAFLAYRYWRVYLQAEATFIGFNNDVECQGNRSTLDINISGLPITVGIYALRGPAFYVAGYGGGGIVIPNLEDDGRQASAIFMGGIEVGFGVGPGAVAVDLRYSKSGISTNTPEIEFDGITGFGAFVGYRYGGRAQ